MLIDGNTKRAYLEIISKATAYQICASIDKKVDHAEINRYLVEIYRYRSMNDETSLINAVKRMDNYLNGLIANCNSSTRSDIVKFISDMQPDNGMDSAIEEMNRSIYLILQTTERIEDTVNFGGVTRKNSIVSTQHTTPKMPSQTTSSATASNPARQTEKPESTMPSKSPTTATLPLQYSGKKIPPLTHVPPVEPEFLRELQSLYTDMKLTARILTYFSTLPLETGLTSEDTAYRMGLPKSDNERVSTTLSNLFKDGKINRVKKCNAFYYYITSDTALPKVHQKTPNRKAMVRFFNHYPVNTVFTTTGIGNALNVPESSFNWLRSILNNLSGEGLLQRELDTSRGATYVYWMETPIPE